MSLLEFHGLRIDFRSRRGHVEAVRGIDLTLERGEILGVVGESGAGKSTLGNAILGLIEPPGEISGGEIIFDGARIDTLPHGMMRRLRGRRIGMIFQDPMTSLNPLMTVGDQIVETIRQHSEISVAEARTRAIELLRDVGIPDPERRANSYPHEFSGGMRQRVVITLALCGDPDLVIADEPTTALDVSVQAQILELLRRLCKARNLGVIFITHDIGVISEITDRVAVMYRGRVVEMGPTEQVLSRPEHPYTKSLMAAVPRSDVKLDRFPRPDYVDLAETNPRRSIDIRTHWIGQGHPIAGPDQDEVLLRVEGLVKTFDTRRSIFPSKRRHFTAVDDVSFDVRRGETLGIVGESGSGKSTIARIIAGLYNPSGGRILFEGREIAEALPRAEMARFRREIQMIFQDPYSSLNPRMRVRDIVAEPIRHHRLTSSRRECDGIVGDLLDHVELGAAAGNRYPHEFSGGQRQRISIARALATRPRFLICDEPTSALDVSIQAQILNLLKDLQAQLGLTTLFISHDLSVIRQICDRVGVMQAGRMVELAETDRLFAAPDHPYTRRLLTIMPKYRH